MELGKYNGRNYNIEKEVSSDEKSKIVKAISDGNILRRYNFLDLLLNGTEKLK